MRLWRKSVLLPSLALAVLLLLVNNTLLASQVTSTRSRSAMVVTSGPDVPAVCQHEFDLPTQKKYERPGYFSTLLLDTFKERINDHSQMLYLGTGRNERQHLHTSRAASEAVRLLRSISRQHSVAAVANLPPFGVVTRGGTVLSLLREGSGAADTDVDIGIFVDNEDPASKDMMTASMQHVRDAFEAQNWTVWAFPCVKFLLVVSKYLKFKWHFKITLEFSFTDVESPTQPYFYLSCPCKPPNATAPIEPFEGMVSLVVDHKCLLFPTIEGWSFGYELPIPKKPLVDLWNEVSHGYRRMCLLHPNRFPAHLNYTARLLPYTTLVNKSGMLHALGYPSLLPLVESFEAANYTWCKTGDDFGFDFGFNFTIEVPLHLRTLVREMCPEHGAMGFNFTGASTLNFTISADEMQRRKVGVFNGYDKPGKFERQYNHHKAAYDAYVRSKGASAL
jgi:hypothetical protein